MKKLKLILLSVLLTGMFSCEEDSDMLTGNANEGGLLNVKNALVAYVIGNGNTFEYQAKLGVFQGNESITSVDVYKKFTNSAGVSSNETLLKSISLPNTPQSQDVTVTATYNELISGLVLSGNPLPASDASLNIGEFWTLRYVAKTSSGKSQANIKTTKIAIGTRFAGTYKVIQGEYWRINVPRPDVMWVGQTRIIESVNSTTYRFLNWVGPFEAATNTHYFTIDANDVVRTPVNYNGTAQLLQGFGVINCEDTPNDIVNACGYAGPQNTVVRDNTTGKDRIYRTYGYYTTGSGPREIYEVLEKVVE